MSKDLTFKVRELVTDKNDPNFGKIVVRRKQALDLGFILSSQKDIVSQMDKHDELKIEYKKLIGKFDDEKDEILARSKTANKIEEFIFKEVDKLSGIGGDPEKFYNIYVTNGNPKKLQTLKDKLLKELTSGPNKLDDINIEVARKNINDGIAHLIAKGLLARGGLITGKGMARQIDVPDPFYDSSLESTPLFDSMVEPLKNMFKSKKGIDGTNIPVQVLKNPQEIYLDIKDPDKVAIFKQVMDDDHFEYFENMVEYMTLIEKGDFSKVKLEGLTRGISTNEAISRAFNLARGMVSPTYVAAEFAVRIAEMRGIQLLGLAANNKEAARIMKDLFEIGVKPSERDVGKLSELIIDFVFTELGRGGVEPPEYIPRNEAEMEEMIEQLKEKYKKENKEE
mgnify:FL=1